MPGIVPNPNICDKSRSPHISLHQQGLLLCSSSEGTSQVGRNHALAFLGNCAGNQHFLERPIPPQMLQTDSQKTEFFRRQTFAIGQAYQPLFDRNLYLSGLELAEHIRVIGIPCKLVRLSGPPLRPQLQPLLRAGPTCRALCFASSLVARWAIQLCASKAHGAPPPAALQSPPTKPTNQLRSVPLPIFVTRQI